MFRLQMFLVTMLLILTFITPHASALFIVDEIGKVAEQAASTTKSVEISNTSSKNNKMRSDEVEHNVQQLMDTKNASDKDISISSVYGYPLEAGMKYLTSPGYIHIFDESNQYQRTISCQNTMKFSELYLETLEKEPYRYTHAGFPALPEFHFSIVESENCYLNQNTLNKEEGCVPTSLSMAIRMLGEEDFDPNILFRELEKSGVDFNKTGTSVKFGVDMLKSLDYIGAQTYMYYYDKLQIIDKILSGKPVVVNIKNNISSDTRNRFVQTSFQPDGYHCIVLSGFFFVNGRLGFEIYDPDCKPEFNNGRGTFIWESSLSQLADTKAFLACTMELAE